MEFNEKVAFQNDIFVYSMHNPLALVSFVVTLLILIAIYLYIVCMSWLIIRKMSETRELMSTKTYQGHKRLLVALGVQVRKASRLGEFRDVKCRFLFQTVMPLLFVVIPVVKFFNDVVFCHATFGSIEVYSNQIRDQNI
jgi:hypothetical protein